MKKAKEYANELVPVFLCLGSYEMMPSLEIAATGTILEAQKDLLEFVKTLVNDQATLDELNKIDLDY